MRNEDALLITINEFADKAGVSPSTIRRWESDGAITSTRDKNGYRKFLISDVEKAVKYKAIVTELRSESTKQAYSQSIISQKAATSSANFTPNLFANFNPSKYFQPKFIVIALIISALPAFAYVLNKNFIKSFDSTFLFRNTEKQQVTSQQQSFHNNISLTQVLAETDVKSSLSINIPTEFNDLTKFNSNIDATGQTLDLTGGELIAPNVIYSVSEGQGISITEGQNPIISLDQENLSKIKEIIVNDKSLLITGPTTLNLDTTNGITTELDTQTNTITFKSTLGTDIESNEVKDGTLSNTDLQYS